MDELKNAYPIYIPKVRDGSVLETGIRFKALLAESPILNQVKKLAKIFPASTDVFIVNPCTHKLFFKETNENKNFKSIGYPKTEYEDLYGNSDKRNSIVKSAFDDQNKKNSSVLVAPFLFSEDVDGIRFNTNLTLLTDSIHFLKKNPTDKPLLGVVYVGNSVLKRAVAINNIIDRYTDENIGKYLKGILVSIDELDCENADLESLIGLARLIFRLSEKTTVFVNNIGVFGEILCVVGAQGYISGAGEGERSSIKDLQIPKGQKKMKYRPRTYIPELFDYINDEEAKNIDYKCSCDACKNDRPKDALTKKLHILHTRQRDMSRLHNIRKDERIDWMKGRLKDAQKLVKKYQDEFGASLKNNHLLKWSDVLESVKNWRSSVEDEKELDILLKEIDSKK